MQFKNNIAPNFEFQYKDLSRSFATTLERLEVRGKTGISDLRCADFSELFIGHSGSIYWTKMDSEKAEIFRKVEPYLTFLDIPQLERQGADIQSKIVELELLNQSLRGRDKLKDDAISQLSDQLVALSTRLQEIERRQQLLT